jgi:hypothetical protein
MWAMIEAADSDSLSTTYGRVVDKLEQAPGIREPEPDLGSVADRSGYG